jgi:hypothetical protein
MTTGRWIIAVAVAVAVATIRARSERFRSLAEYHAARIARWSRGSDGRYRMYVDGRGELVTRAASDWHSHLVEKYERAARYPWLLVEPDPPEPQ